MYSLLSSLCKPYVIIDHPVKYVVILFLAIMGGFHLAFYAWANISGNPYNPERIIVYALVFSAMRFLSLYVQQKRLREAAN